MTDILPAFPLDGETLDLLEAALANGGGLGAVLRVLSGYDPETCDRTLPLVAVNQRGSYSPADVIRALVVRVRELDTGGCE